MKQICLFGFLFISSFCYSQLNYLAANEPFTYGHFNDVVAGSKNAFFYYDNIESPGGSKLINDASVDALYALYQLPLPCGDPEVIRARVTNTGETVLTNLPVTLSITAPFTFTSTKLVTLAPGASTVVTFDPNTPTSYYQAINVSVPTDDVTSNNILYFTQNTSLNSDQIFSYAANYASPSGKVGWDNNAGLLLVKYHMGCTDTVKTVRINLDNSAENTGNTVYAVLLDASGTIVSQSNPLVIASTDLGRTHDFILNNPPGISNADFYVGLAQSANATTAYKPLAVQDEPSPTRPGAYYRVAGLAGGLPVETLVDGKFMIQAVLTPHYDKFDYAAINGQNISGVYTDLGASGSAITTNFSGTAMTFGDDNSSPQNIGFNFNYNGTTFTKFVLNTNGFIKLGTTAAVVNNYDVLNSSDINIIAPFNFDLIAGTGTPEYRVSTSGSVGSRICTIQFENVRDKLPSQYNNINFQIKLYETSNRIEFVYGTFTPTAAAGSTIQTIVGIKGWNVQNSVNVTKASGTAWASTTFLDGPYSGNKFNNWNSTLPGSGRIYRFSSITDAKVEAVYAYTKVPLPLGTYNQIVRAKIRNAGSVFLNDLPVTLNVTGANSFTNSQIISVLAPGDSAMVSFNPFSSTTLGNNTITVSTPADDNNTNNSSVVAQVVNDTLFSYSTSSPSDGNDGFGNNGGQILTSFSATGGSVLVTHVKVRISNDPANVGNSVRALIWDNGSIGNKYSDYYTITNLDLGTDKIFAINDPVPISNLNFNEVGIRVGLEQTANATTAYYPVSYQNQSPSTNYNYPAKRLMIEAIVHVAPVTPSFPLLPLMAWNFTGMNSPDSAAATTQHSSLISSNKLKRGPGAGISSCTDCFQTDGFHNDGISVLNDDYFQFELAPRTGDTVSLYSLNFEGGGDAAFGAYPGVQYQYAYSFDGLNFTLLKSPANAFQNGNVYVDDIPQFQNIVSPTKITFRFYASGMTANGNWGFVSIVSRDGLLVYGRVKNHTISTSPTAPPGADFILPTCASTANSSISFTSTGIYPPGNIYIARMNTSTFWPDTNYVSIGSLASTANAGIINITIPTGLRYDPYDLNRNVYSISVGSNLYPDAVTSSSHWFRVIQSSSCNSQYDYFRSVQSGDWNNPSTWEISNDQVTWFATTLVPDQWARQVKIDSTDTVTIRTPVNMRNTIVYGKIKLINNAVNPGSMTFFKNKPYYYGNDMIDYGMTIKRSGILQIVSSTSIFDSVVKISNTYWTGRRLLISNLGKIIIGDGSANMADGFYKFATTGQRFSFWDASVFEWNSSSSFGPISNATYFVDSYQHWYYGYYYFGHPILRLSVMPAGDFGSSDSTRINGILEINTPVTMTGSGKKVFRDGVKGNSTLTQLSGSGEFRTLNPFLVIPQTDSTGATIGIMDGTVQINLAAAGLIFEQGITVTDTADVIINNGISHSFDTVEVKPGGHLTIEGSSGLMAMASGPSELLLDNSDLINRGTISGPGTIRFTGNQVSKLNSPGLITAPILMVNKEVKLTGSSNISQLDLTSNSHITLDSFHLSMGAAPITADNANFIITNDTGRLIRNVTSSEVLFPVGVNNTSYTPVTATNSGIADNLKVRVNPGVSFVVPLDQGNVDRTWFIDSTQGGSILSIKTQWNSNNEQSGFDRSNCFLSQSHGCQPPPNCIDTYYDAAGRTAATGSDPYIQVRSNVTGPTSFIVKSSADTSTFTGNAGNGLWNDPNNWTIGVVPSQTIANGKIIVINYTNGVPCTAIGNIIIQPGGQLIINPNKILTVTGNIINQ